MSRRASARAKTQRSKPDGTAAGRVGPAPSANSTAARELADVEAVFAALAHSSRRHILLVLRFRGGEMTAGEIAARFACRWPTTTRHLRILESAGLVHVEKRGRERIYHLDRERLLKVTSRWFEAFGETTAV